MSQSSNLPVKVKWILAIVLVFGLGGIVASFFSSDPEDPLFATICFGAGCILPVLLVLWLTGRSSRQNKRGGDKVSTAQSAKTTQTEAQVLETELKDPAKKQAHKKDVPESFSNPKDAVLFLFERIAIDLPILTESQFKAAYERMRRAWGNLPLVEGPAEAVKKVLLTNTKTFSQRDDFKNFSIELCLAERGYKNEEAVQLWGQMNSGGVVAHIWITENGLRAYGRPELLGAESVKFKSDSGIEKISTQNTSKQPEIIPYQPGQREPEEYALYIAGLVKQKSENKLHQIVVLIGFESHDVVKDVLGQVAEIGLHTDDIKAVPQFGDRNPLIELRYDDTVDQNLVETDARALKGWGATDISAVGISQETLKEFQYWYGEKSCPFLVATKE